MASKFKILLLVFSVMYGSSCSDDEQLAQLPNLQGTWNIKQIKGGISGISDEYEPGTITWDFDMGSSKVFVENNNEEERIYDGLPSGTYAYSTLFRNGRFYLFIQETEFGLISVAEPGMTLDQNQTSSGPGADQYILDFKR